MKNKAFIHEHEGKLFIRTQTSSGHWVDNKINPEVLNEFLIKHTEMNVYDINRITDGK